MAYLHLGWRYSSFYQLQDPKQETTCHPPKSIDLLIAQASNQCAHILSVSFAGSCDDSTS